MDPVYSAEDTASASGAKSKTGLILLVGVAGALLGAGSVAFLFRNSVTLTAPATENTSALSYPDSSKAPSAKVNILLPKSLVGKNYYLLINKIVNEFNQIGANNNVTLLPLMDSIKQKSAAGDFNGFFDLVIQARGEIKKNTDLLATTQEDVMAFKKINNEGTADEDIHNQTALFLTSADALVQAFTDYFATLGETLSGSVPTQELLDRLAERATVLQTAGASFQSALNALLTLIQQKDKTQAP